jgi:chorismate dehydratase
VNPQPFRIGSVHYLNALPLTHGLGTDLVRLPPSKLAVEMHAGRLDAALLSITEALFHPEHEILDGVGILSRGPVYSVGLAHRQPLSAIREIHLDPASCTSVNLLRILLERCGCHPRLLPLADYASAPQHDNVLLIGNPAIDFRRAHGGSTEIPGATGHRWLDLGELWQAQEGLPFTYAAWVLRKDSAPALRQRLLDSAAQGFAAIDDIITTRPEYDPAFRRAYLGGFIQYHMDAPARAGIHRFAERLTALSERPVHPPRFVS